MARKKPGPPDEYEIICRPYITLKNGVRIYAAQKGLKAFCFPVRRK